MPHAVRCPICGKNGDFFEEPVGPFCSSRCKMVDLSKWLDEDYKISEPLRADHLEDYGDMEGPHLDTPEPE